MSGYVAISRELFDHPVFAPDPYSEREAWMWLIASATWKPKSIRVGDTIYQLERGQCAFALRFLAEKWRWPKSNVWDFLNRLKKSDMVRTQGGRDATLITICNYDKYQKAPDAVRTPPERTPGHRPDKEKPLNHRTIDEDDGRALAFKVAEEVAELCGHPDPTHWPPGFCGAPVTVAKWLRGGWSRDVIIAGVKEALARKRDGPPDSVNYFEKPIAKHAAGLSAPLPRYENGSDRQQNHGNSALAAIRQMQSELGGETDRDVVVSLPTGRLRGP